MYLCAKSNVCKSSNNIFIGFSGAECKSYCGLKCRKREYSVSSDNAIALMANFTTRKLFHGKLRFLIDDM